LSPEDKQQGGNTGSGDKYGNQAIGRIHDVS
jgi:hypothetical protein